MDEVHNAVDGGLTFPTYADREAGERLVEATVGPDDEDARAAPPDGSLAPADEHPGSVRRRATL
jgi:hypothetical protein